jgi:hypothetical protein
VSGTENQIEFAAKLVPTTAVPEELDQVVAESEELDQVVAELDLFPLRSICHVDRRHNNLNQDLGKPRPGSLLPRVATGWRSRIACAVKVRQTGAKHHRGVYHERENFQT